MSENNRESKSALEVAGEDLFNFAINREDVKSLILHLPEAATCKSETVEYELQILKVISTGWAISFFLDDSPYRDQLVENFWKTIHEFAGTLSETTRLMTGREIDYFQALKDRLGMYVQSLSEKNEATEPAAVIGPEFARVCGNCQDVFAVLAGSRMFIMTVASVKEYLAAVNLQ